MGRIKIIETRIGQKMWRSTGKEIGCEVNIHIFVILILLCVIQIYYSIFRVIIVQNIANFSDNVT